MTKEELKIAKLKYQNKKYQCKYRKDLNGNPIEMRLTFEEWLEIWIDSGHYNHMGARKDHYVMSRINDTGHYEIGNVQIVTKLENDLEYLKSDHYKEVNVPKRKGKNPWNSRKIKTPAGIFDSGNKAGAYYKVSGGTIFNWIKSKKEGFDFA